MSMTQIPKVWLASGLAVAILGLSATAIAQGGAGPDPAAKPAMAGQSGEARPMGQMHHRAHREHRQAHQAERLDQLKAELRLTPEQEPAWRAFVARTTAPEAVPNRTERMQDPDMTTLERLARMEERHEAHTTALKQRIEATRSFYAQLSEEQKQLFDRQVMGGIMRTGHHGGQGGHRMPMGGQYRH
jgi:protein CpxP